MTEQNNIPAFPRPFSIATGGVMVPDQGGMTLRDYFAGQVLANMDIFEITDDDGPDGVAVVTYRIADAMLKARERS